MISFDLGGLNGTTCNAYSVDVRYLALAVEERRNRKTRFGRKCSSRVV